MVNDKEFLHYSDGIFKPYFEKFIEYKRSKGEKVAHSALIRMKYLNDELNQSGCLHVTKETAESILSPKDGTSEKTRYKRVCTLRQFLNFMNAMGIECYRIPPRYCKFVHSEFRPYIFSDREIENLLNAADNLKDWNHAQRRHDVYPVILRLLIGTGMRISEVLSLKPTDVDAENGILKVINGKNGVCRYVPMSDSLTTVVCDYLLLHLEDKWLFTSPKTDICYSYITIRGMFKKLCITAGIFRADGKTPNIHSLRHTFCTKSLDQLLASGTDVYTAIPILAAYVGHVNFRDTERYIHFTENGFDSFQEKQKNLRSLIPEVRDDE